jgi:hypothetical protein
MLTLKLPRWLWALVIAGVVVLVISLIRGCNKSNSNIKHINELMALTDSFASVSNRAVAGWQESKKRFDDSLEFERGQRLLVEAQKERTEDDLAKAHAANKALLDKYNLQQYADTSMVSAPVEFIADCHDCFKQLKITDNLSLKYKKEVSDWGVKYERETLRIQNRYKEVERERDSYFHKVDSLTGIQKKAVSKIEPKGRLYLSWGVLWRPWPVAAGAGLMYQSKRNLIWGLKGYYGHGGTTVETNINFPLSLKFR